MEKKINYKDKTLVVRSLAMMDVMALTFTGKIGDLACMISASLSPESKKILEETLFINKIDFKLFDELFAAFKECNLCFFQNPSSVEGTGNESIKKDS